MRTFKMKAKRFLAVLMTILLTWTLIPAAALEVQAGENGSFVLMALSGGRALIQPTTIFYSQGATVKEALLQSGYSFTGLAEDDWISAVEGVTDSYVLYYDNEGYDLSLSADEITAIWITGNYEQGYSDALLGLEKTLAEYREAEDGRQQYAPLAEAAEAALSGFWEADAVQAAALEAELLTQTENYMEIIHGDTAPLVLQITQGGTAVVPAVCAFTDAYGTKTEFQYPEDGRISLVPGDYTFDISDGIYSHVRGSVTVTAGTENNLTAELPSGQWIADVDMGIKNNWTEAVSKTGSLGSDRMYYVPDYAGTNLYPYVANADGIDTETVSLYFGTDGSVGTASKNWNSHTASVSNAIERDSLQGKTVTIQAVTPGPDGYEQVQSYDVAVVRIPTLENLTLSSEGTTLPLGYDRETTEYSLSVVSDTVDVTGTLLCQEAELTVNGTAAVSGEPVAVQLQDNAVTDVTVTASAGGLQQSYLLHIEKKPSAKVTIKHAAGMETSLENAAGAVILPATSTGTLDTYHLTPGEVYTWIGTKNTYYHTSGTFTVTENLSVTAATPITEDWMSGLAAKSTTASTAVIYQMVPEFSSSVHELDIRVGTSRTLFYLRADLTDSSYGLHASYKNYQGTQVEKDITTGKFMTLASIVNQTGKGTDLLLTVTKDDTSAGVKYYQEYQATICKLMELNAMSVADTNGNTVVLTQNNGSEKTTFDTTVLEYKAGVQKSLQELVISAKLYSALTGNDTDAVITVASQEGSAEITYDAEHQPNEFRSVSVPLNQNTRQEDVTVTVSHPDSHAVSQIYTIHVTKLDPAMVTVQTTPADATVFLLDDLSGKRILPEEDGRYSLCDTLSYTYTITAQGYVGVEGSFVASKDVNRITVALEKAQETSYTDISGEDDWGSFRQDEDNNGVTSSATPISSEDTVLVWANKIGDGYGSGATGCPILVGGYLYTYAGSSLVKVDKNTGEIVQSGSMVGNSSFAINSPTYAAGMIFVGLSNGRVQAFNAETLESLWVYADPLGGQSNSSITYKNGYVYTGFWNGETNTANFVCLSVTDEDPSNATEAKLASWRYTDSGFYWAGAYATDEYVLVTTDDGASGTTTGYGSVVSLNPSTGQIIDSMQMSCVGDLRSSICYDAATDACYFTSKGGYFCRIRVNEDGSFRENSLETLKLSNGTDGTAMSTSTPTIYKGRAYIGVCGTAQFTPYTGHNITVIDLASWTIAYSVPTQGYPQTSGLLTTAYEGTDEYVYVYFLDNYTPGKIRVIRDKAGQTALDPEYTTTETYVSKGVTYEYQTAYVLFTPSGKQAQYAICSPIVDADGNLYFKNDSAQLMKLSSTITSLEVTQEQETSVYCVGQTFDPTGMKVTVRYANGTIKDITEYTSCYLDEDLEQEAGANPLTAETTTVYLKYDLNKMLKGDTGYWALYHNEGGEAGVEAATIPNGQVKIQVESEHPDLDNDGICDRCGVQCKFPAEILEQPQTVRAGLKAKISYHVTAEHAVSYLWQYSKDGIKWYNSSSASAKTDTLSITISASNKANRYRCKITGEDKGVIYTDIVRIDLIPGVTIQTQPVSVATALGQTITFTVAAENVAEGGYQWQYSKDGTSWYNSTVASAKKSSFSVTTATQNRFNYYRCKMVGLDGNAVTTKTVGYVVITKQPENSSAAVGTKASYSVEGLDIVSYQWEYSKDQGAHWYKSSASGATTTTISITASLSNQDTIYRCKLADERRIGGYSLPAGFEKGITITEQPKDVKAAVGQQAAFTVQAQNVAEGGYQWYYSKDGVKWYKSGATGATSKTVKITVSTTNKDNVYRCKLTGTDGSVLYTDTVRVLTN